jgi:hypothetical protein
MKLVHLSLTPAEPPLEVEYRFTPFGLGFVRILDEGRRPQRTIGEETC